ncbi:hypothetical protein PLICRDRAFT_36311 [Plicaturopsis crispa FD-325 SS-3]|nr:hypothetical protein PLICRDRAFT_36311 [Plicaturopsis crispa FD-325 SS-3]
MSSPSTPPTAAEAAQRPKITTPDQYQTQLLAQNSKWLASQPEPQPNDDVSWVKARTAQSNTALAVAWAARDQLAAQLKAAPTDPALKARMVAGVARLIEHRVERERFYWRTFPLLHLPPEILTHILRAVVFGAAGTIKAAFQQRTRLTWVCGLVRRVAIADVQLWNGIWFRDPPPYERSLTWFARAQGAPLDIRINERLDEWKNGAAEHPYTKEHMEWLLDQLFTKFSQIRLLTITVDNWPPCLVVLDRLRKMGENKDVEMNLERFELHRSGNPYVWVGPGHDAELDRHPIVLCGGRAPKLKHVTLNGVHVDWFKSPLANLTTLDIRRLAVDVCPSSKRFRELLFGCPNLHKLCLDGAGPRMDNSLAGRILPVDIPSLVILVLGDVMPEYGVYLLEHFRAPNIRDLTLMNLTEHDYSPFLYRLIGSCKQVRILTLYSVEIPETPTSRTMIPLWLDSMPLVVYLRICKISANVIKAFTLGRVSRPDPAAMDVDSQQGQAEEKLVPVCPKIKILEYQMMRASDIITFGLRRKDVGFPLSRIYVNAPWAPHVRKEEAAEMSKIAVLYYAPVGLNTDEQRAALNS